MSNLIARTSIFVAGLAVAGASVCQASFQITYTPPFRGQIDTHYSGWESFLYAYGQANFPDDPASTTINSVLDQLTPGAYITPQGNIDHLTLPPSFRLYDSVPCDLQEVVLQVSINLNQFDWSSFVLMYTDAGGSPHSVAPTSSTYLIHLMGHDERVITWDLSGIADEIQGYTIDFSAALPSTQLDAVKLDTRFACPTGVAFCAGDGSGAPCACASGAPGRGCENSFGTGGGLLTGTGTTALAQDTLVLTASGLPPTTSVLFYQGSAQLAGGAGASFGDGLRCAAGTVVRLGAKMTSAGTASFGHGIGTDPDISVIGMVASGVGLTRYYQAWYRNAAPYCTGATFNTTNGFAVDW